MAKNVKNLKNTNETGSKQKHENFLYHNTEILLKHYRDVVWSVEASVLQAELGFELEMNCKLEEFLEMSYVAGADLSGTDIQEHMRTLERNKKMLQTVDMAVKSLRERHANGDEYYWILYYTYLSEKPCKCLDDIVAKIEEKTKPMAWKTYYKKRNMAIRALSVLLWGYFTKEGIAMICDLTSQSDN